MSDIQLETGRLIARTLGPEAAPIVLDYHARNRAFHRPWNPRTPDEYFTLEAQRAILERNAALLADDRGVRFWLFAREDAAGARVLGDIGLSNIIRGAFQSCHLGYKMDEAHGGQGLMTEALRAVLGYAFGPLRLHRVEANVMPRNERSRRVLARLGFIEEGLAPQYLQINGVWEDHIHFALINPHYDG